VIEGARAAEERTVLESIDRNINVGVMVGNGEMRMHVTLRRPANNNGPEYGGSGSCGAFRRMPDYASLFRSLSFWYRPQAEPKASPGVCLTLFNPFRYLKYSIRLSSAEMSYAQSLTIIAA
jgi:hypothetical protein